MAICSVEEAVEEIRKGHMVILVDDEDRENEGDITIAAEFVTPEAINFMAKYARGLICLALGPSMVDKLDLPLMTPAQRFKIRYKLHCIHRGEARRDHRYFRGRSCTHYPDRCRG